MKCLLFFMVVVARLMEIYAQINVLRPECDSPEAEEAALAALDYLNFQHTHGYKYALNRIEDIKIITTPDGDNTYVMEIDLLETDCHVLDPTPTGNCTVRPKVLTAVEGDCDVILKNVSGVLTVTAFKCKTEESREDMCLQCPTLLPLNDTTALDFVQASLVTFNNITENITFSLLEVGRISSQIVSGGPIFSAEYVVVEANCTENVCEPLNDPMASRGLCTAKGLTSQHTIECKMFPNLVNVVDGNSSTPIAPAVHVRTNNLSPVHGQRHHRLTAFHDPLALLSAESAESAEVVPTAPAPATDATQAAVPALAIDLVTETVNSKEIGPLMFKRDLAAVVAAVDVPVPLVPVCPGRIRFFD